MSGALTERMETGWVSVVVFQYRKHGVKRRLSDAGGRRVIHINNGMIHVLIPFFLFLYRRGGFSHQTSM